MPKRRREPEEDELETVAKRVHVLDNVVCGKRSMALEEFVPNKRQRHEDVIKYKAQEYRACIRKLYRIMACR